MDASVKMDYKCGIKSITGPCTQAFVRKDRNMAVRSDGLKLKADLNPKDERRASVQGRGQASARHRCSVLAMRHV